MVNKKNKARLSVIFIVLATIGMIGFQVSWLHKHYIETKGSIEDQVKETIQIANFSTLSKKVFPVYSVEINGVTKTKSGQVTISKPATKNDREPLDENTVQVSGRSTTSTSLSFKNFERYPKLDSLIEYTNKSEPIKLHKTRSAAVSDVNEQQTQTQFDTTDFAFFYNFIKEKLSDKGINSDLQLEVRDIIGDSSTFSRGYLNPNLKKKDFSVKMVNPTSQDLSASVSIPLRKMNLAIILKMRTVIITSAVTLILFLTGQFFLLRYMRHQEQLILFKNDFIGNMTHELKTPIAAANLAQQLLADSDRVKSSPALRKLTAHLGEKHEKLSHLVDEILDGASVEYRKDQFKLEPVRIAFLINDMVNQKRESGFDIKLSQSREAAEYFILGDEFHLKNAVENLLENAFKYSIQKEVEVEVSTKIENQYFILSIKDQGVGIAKRDLKNIFNKFYRVNTQNVHDIPGFGIGLHYTKTVVEHHKGSIHALSELGKGSTFIVKIPAINEK